MVLACGGSSYGDDNGKSSPTAQAASPTSAVSPTVEARGEDALAESFLFSQARFPFEDWLEKTRSPERNKNPLDGDCGGDFERGITGRAGSGDLLFDGLSPLITEVIELYASDADATAALGRAQAMVNCAVAEINAGKIDGEGTTYSGAASTPIEVLAGATPAAAWEIRAKGLTASGADRKPIYTVIVGQKGRALYEIYTSSTGAPIDEDLSELATFAAGLITLPVSR